MRLKAALEGKLPNSEQYYFAHPPFRMITVQLTKLEVALEQVRKSYPKLKPADAALVTTALVCTGRQALAVYEGEKYEWPTDNESLTKALSVQLKEVQGTIEPPKKSAKNVVEEEPIQVTVGLVSNLAAGESVLKSRDDLKTLLSDILQEGVEYAYQTTDIGWQWALDRTNWKTAGGEELSRRIKIKAAFTEGASGVEIGLTAGKKKAKSTKATIKNLDKSIESETRLENDIDSDSDSEDKSE